MLGEISHPGVDGSGGEVSVMTSQDLLKIASLSNRLADAVMQRR